MSAEFHEHAAVVTAVSQRLQQRRKIHLPLAKHQVLMHAAPHVFEMYIDNPVGPIPDALFNRDFTEAMQMSQVECQLQRFAIRLQPISQLAKLVHRIDEHTRLGFEADRDLARLGVSDHRTQSYRQAIPQRIDFGIIVRSAGPK